MESDKSSFVDAICKIVGCIILVAVTILYFIRFEGPGAQQWFDDHPVIHFFDKLIHLLG